MILSVNNLASAGQVLIVFSNFAVLQEYSQVYLDMSLSCPGHTDYNCPHWDHTVQLFLDCGSSSFAGEEIGRWITPFRR